MNTPIAFINEHFIAVDKPHGVLTTPSRTGSSDPRACLGIELQKKYGRLFPVHRLDFEVSGLVLFARTPQSHKDANGWFEDRLIKKTYEALTSALPVYIVGKKFEWHMKLQKGKKRSFISDRGKDSTTLAACLREIEVNKKKSYLWKLEPLTGRPHQLRVALAQNGYPILGDTLYGSLEAYTEQSNAIALRSIQLNFSDCPAASKYGLPPSVELKGISA